LITKHKPLHYFESHPIHVVTSFGLGEIIGNRLSTGRIAKWALELMGLDITYVSQMVIKSQALEDFVAEWIETQQQPSGYLGVLEHVFRWLFHPQRCQGDVVLVSPNGDRLLYVIQLHFHTTNKVAEYEALVNGLRIAAELGV
jgi:hypothetical protein